MRWSEEELRPTGRTGYSGLGVLFAGGCGCGCVARTRVAVGSGFHQFSPLFLRAFLQLLVPVLPHVDPLADVPDRRVLEESCEDHDEAGAQENVDGLDVGDFGQLRIGRGHESGHCQHRQHAQLHAGRGRVAVEPEGHPGYDDDQRCWDVDLDEVVAHRTDQLHFANQARIVSLGETGAITQQLHNVHFVPLLLFACSSFLRPLVPA